MKLKIETNIELFIIEDGERLDPVTVILKDDGSRGKVLIECYGEAWSTYFGGIGTKSLIGFIAGIDAGYLMNRLVSNTFHRPPKRETDYVNRISQAVIDACKFKKGEK